jgi:hypothetical protein
MEKAKSEVGTVHNLIDFMEDVASQRHVQEGEMA